MSKVRNDKRVCGETIRKHRIAWGISQETLGRKVGITTAVVNKIENNPDYLASQRVAFILATELINNPPPENNEAWNLINKWNMEGV